MYVGVYVLVRFVVVSRTDDVVVFDDASSLERFMRCVAGRIFARARVVCRVSSVRASCNEERFFFENQAQRRRWKW